MPLRINEYVLRLQVAVCDSFNLVQELKHKRDLGRVELGNRLLELGRPSQVCKDLAARAVVQQHVQVFGIGKGGDEGSDERVARDRAQCGALVADMLDLL